MGHWKRGAGVGAADAIRACQVKRFKNDWSANRGHPVKRRAAAQVVIKAGILAGELPAATDPDVLLDALYGGLYYRLLMGTGPLSDACVEAVWRTVLCRRGGFHLSLRKVD
jgi:hypothetical protein